MSSVKDYWKSSAWPFQSKADALYDLFGGVITLEATIGIDNATNNAVTDLLTLRHTTTGTPAAGIGGAIVFDLENSTPATKEAGRIEVSFATVTASSEDSNMAFKVYDGGTLVTPLQITGATPVVAVTGQLTVSAVATFSAEPTVVIDDASNSAVTDLLTLKHTTSGSPAAGLGGALVFDLENSTPAVKEGGRVEVSFTTVTAGSEDSNMAFKVQDGGSSITPLLIVGATPDVQIEGDLTLQDGGTVTQITSITTGVTLNTHSGQITTVTAPSIAAGAEATFTVTNSKVAVTDVIIVNVNDQFTDGLVIAAVTAIAAGSFNITLTNVDAAAVSAGAAVINFVVIGGSAS